MGLHSNLSNTDTVYHNNHADLHGGVYWFEHWGRLDNLRTLYTNNSGAWGGVIFMWFNAVINNTQTVWRYVDTLMNIIIFIKTLWIITECRSMLINVDQNWALIPM